MNDRQRFGRSSLGGGSGFGSSLGGTSLRGSSLGGGLGLGSSLGGSSIGGGLGFGSSLGGSSLGGSSPSMPGLGVGSSLGGSSLRGSSIGGGLGFGSSLGGSSLGGSSPSMSGLGVGRSLGGPDSLGVNGGIGAGCQASPDMSNRGTFNAAFAKAHEELGPGKTFQWKGSSYTTNRADASPDFTNHGSFNAAFAKAHEKLGPGKTFQWKDGSYTTSRADGRDRSMPGSNVWVYESSTGHMYDDSGKRVANGYSGKGNDKNKSSSDHLKNSGPIPRGRYTLGNMRTSAATGKDVIDLKPDASNDMHGRNSFQMHGDNKKMNGTASEGCIIMPNGVRHRFHNECDVLKVVAHKK